MSRASIIERVQWACKRAWRRGAERLVSTTSRVPLTSRREDREDSQKAPRKGMSSPATTTTTTCHDLLLSLTGRGTKALQSRQGGRNVWKNGVVGSPERLTLLGLAGHTPQLVHRDDEGRMVSLLSHFTHSQVLDYSVVVLVPLPGRNAQNHRTSSLRDERLCQTA
ncbi:uncharacterized protein LOC135093000 isoform X2 [Scylla paramamosain]|uniref:uncharacterized protein LOC135093000 isoform X2 n=1 Tax=Scylla paramamosain TaxID=85552 RepID=UPI0030829CA2